MQRVVFLFVVLLIAVSSCDKNNERSGIIGAWNCNEISDLGVIKNYQVTILNDDANPSFYKMYNFSNIGSSESNIVYCFMNNDDNLQINSQVVGDVFISEGIGIVADDYSTIEWEYIYSDGMVSNVTINATYY